MFGDDGDQEDTTGAENSGGQNERSPGQQDNGNSGQQDNGFSGGGDAEISSELGTEEPEKAQKGFFARLFGDEPDEDAEGEEDTGGEQGADKVTVKKDKEQTGKKAGKRAKEGQDPQEKKADPLQKKRDSERSDSLEQSIIYWQGHDKIPERLEDTKNTLTEVLGLGSSFDIVFREMTFGGRKAALLCISGFAKDTIIDEILKRLTYLTPDEVSTGALSSFMTEYIPHVQVEKGELLSESINKVLSGMSAFFLEGENQVIIMDTRAYPARGPDEPSIERVVRGARDGFTETLLSNVALVRRRIRDPGLKYEMHQVGRRTRTDVCVAYIDDIVDKTQVLAVTDKIKSIDIDGIPLADKQLEEAIVGRGWNPYPLVRYSERPDTVASHLLEGRVVIFVDTSPSVIVLPTTFFDLCQHAEENRQTPFMGTYLRWVRFIGVFASMFLLPLWMLLVIHPELKPAMLEFIGPQKMAKIPLLAQFLIVELGVDLLRMAAVHTPTPLGSAMGLIAAILVGDIAVQTGLFVNEVVLYMAVASIGMFATPSYELGLANRIVRLALLLAVAVFQVPGFMIGTTLLIILLTTHRSYNSSYLWPFIPFNAKALGAILVRQPVLSSKARPSFNKTRDNTRMPPVQENEK
ncbi:spore germination protein [Paenibacillus camerounensis]|uniref:spore germination protein n=1 Tax=Paenibacillus camerounensis TaxID=1243663 RepID=UPI003CC6FCB3